MTEVINAFHPDYVKTYHPELLTSIKTEAAQKANGAAAGTRAKATRESADKGAFTINKFPKTKSATRTLEKAQSKAALEEKKRKMLAVTDFHTFSKAGMPKGVK